jgi:hypothetical protein
VVRAFPAPPRHDDAAGQFVVVPWQAARGRTGHVAGGAVVSVPSRTTRPDRGTCHRRVRLTDVAAAALDLPAGTEGVVYHQLTPFGPYLVAVAAIADDLLILDEAEFTWLATGPLPGVPAAADLNGARQRALGVA